MPGIETRVVQVKFDNAQFESAIQKTLSSLKSLDAGLKLDGATKGLDDVGRAAGRFNLGNMGSTVESVGAKFGAMSVVAVTALATITSKAISTGASLVKSLAIQPITSGFNEYETGLNSVQTILANTQAAGTGLKDVNATLQELNTYSDQTIYNFQEMAKNIGTFTAAGVDLKTATASIKGIANLAALSGSNSEQASGAMYQLSQAISAGRVSLEDWNSVVNAGMGGTVFQRALAQNAEKMGTLTKGAVKLKGEMKNVTIGGQSFRESITAKPGQESWLTSDVLTRTLSQFTGDLSAADLAAQGFNKSEIKAIQAQAKTAKGAATEVKTLSQLLDTTKESVGSGWAQTWQLIFGDFTEAKSLFTNVNNVMGGFIQATSNARNKVLGDWKALGGRTVLIEAIGNAFKALVSVVTPIKNAFRDIFPPTTGKQLYDLSVSIRNFTQGLTIGADTASKLRRTFAGVFAVFGIGVEIIKQVAKMFFNLFKSAGENSGSFLDITASVGDFLVKLHDALVNGQGLAQFFKGFSKVLQVPINAIKLLGDLISSAFSGDTPGLDAFQERFAPLGKLGEVIAFVWGKAVGLMGKVWDQFQEFAPELSDAFGALMDNIMDAFSGGNYDKILDGINTGLFAALVLAFKKFASGNLFGDINVGEGFFESIKGSFEQLTGTLSAMQQQLKAGTLLKIAGAIALLTASVVALSLIDSDKLTSALVALTVMFTQLTVAMALFAKSISGAGVIQLPLAAAGLVLFAAAIDLLTISVVALSKLSWEELAKGLGGVVALITVLVGAVRLMAGQAAGMVTAGAGLLLLAAGIKVLASAVTDLSGLSWEEMAKGLGGVAALLIALGLFTKFASADAGGVLAGAGIVLLATGIKVLASALVDIAQMSWAEMAKGLAGMAGGLVLIGAALMLIPPSSVLSAAAVLVVATSLNLLVVALGQMAEMSWEEIAKGLVVMASSLTIIGLAVTGMTGALAGAAALLVVSAALVVITPVLITLGAMSWESIIKGLLTLAGALTVIGVAGLVLAPVVPVLFGLAGSVALLGVGMLAAGAGVIAFSIGLTALSVAGVAGAKALVGIVMTLISAVPQLLGQVKDIIVAFAKMVAAAAPAVFKAMTVVITQLLKAIQKIAPQVISTMLKLLTNLLSQLANAVPKMVSMGFKILIGFLSGISQNIGKVVKVATDIIVNFLNALAKSQGRITDAGVKLIIAFVNGLANAIRAHQSEMNAAGLNLGKAIIDGMLAGLKSGAGAIANMAGSVAKGALSSAKNILGIHSPSKEFEKIGKFVIKGFLNGLQGNQSDITGAFESLKSQLSDFYQDSKDNVKTLETKLKKLTTARKLDTKAIKETMKELGQARIERDQASAAYTQLTKHTLAQRNALKALSTQADAVATKLDAAQDKLKQAIQTRDDYQRQLTQQYSALPDIGADTKLPDFEEQLKAQIVQTKAYAAMLQKLRTLGLNDDLYTELLSKGVSAAPFVSQLLDQGKAGVTELNSLDATLVKSATTLGDTASNNLYQAGVNAAQGLVDGLKKQQKAIDAQMEKIADAMVAAIKKKLKIKSPSRAFAEIGAFSTAGLAKGLADTSSVAEKTAGKVGKDAILALQKSISQTDKMGVSSLTLQPTIRPVIDLTDVKKGADQISSLVPSTASLGVGSSYSQAVQAKMSYDSNANATTDVANSTAAPKEVNFIQNNNSPKALSPADIYRQTRNQLSQAKGALTK